MKEKQTKRFFPKNKLTVWPKKQSDKLEVLNYIATNFLTKNEYSESELNSIIRNIYDDYALIRRSLVDYNYFIRTKDCHFYYKNKKNEQGEFNVEK